MAREFKIAPFKQQFNLFNLTLEKWPAYIPTLEALKELSAKELIQETGVQKIMFTVRDILRNVHWSFNSKSDRIWLL
jgi:hypothetical protein